MRPRILGGWIEPRTIAIAAYLITRMLLPRPDAERQSIMSEIAEPELVRETALDELGEWMSEHPEGLLLAVSASAAYPHALRAGTRTLRRVRVALYKKQTCCLLDKMDHFAVENNRAYCLQQAAQWVRRRIKLRVGVSTPPTPRALTCEDYALHSKKLFPIERELYNRLKWLRSTDAVHNDPNVRLFSDAVAWDWNHRPRDTSDGFNMAYLKLDGQTPHNCTTTKALFFLEANRGA